MEALGITLSGLIAYIVNFSILVFFLQRFLYKPVRGMLEQRQTRIAEGLAAAEKVRHEADQQRQEFESELAKARATSRTEAQKIAEATEKMRQKILEDAKKEAEQIKTQAKTEATQEKQQLGTEIKREAAELAMQMTRKIVGTGLDEKVQRKLLDQFLANLGDA